MKVGEYYWLSKKRRYGETIMLCKVKSVSDDLVDFVCVLKRHKMGNRLITPNFIKNYGVGRVVKINRKKFLKFPSLPNLGACRVQNAVVLFTQFNIRYSYRRLQKKELNNLLAVLL